MCNASLLQASHPSKAQPSSFTNKTKLVSRAHKDTKSTLEKCIYTRKWWLPQKFRWRKLLFQTWFWDYDFNEILLLKLWPASPIWKSIGNLNPTQSDKRRPGNLVFFSASDSKVGCFKSDSWPWETATLTSDLGTCRNVLRPTKRSTLFGS